MRFMALENLAAGVIALAVVIGFPLSQLNANVVFSDINRAVMEDYTPYFPGLNDISSHELFSPKYKNKKKIVLLGASSVDSIGCDYTWHAPEVDQARNVHYTCSIAAHLNRLLAKGGRDDWRAFNLARNGSKLSTDLYIFAKILSIHPDVVVFGDSFNYYMWENAGANDLSAEQFRFMDSVFSDDPDAAETWREFKNKMEAEGWSPEQSTEPLTQEIAVAESEAAISLKDYLVKKMIEFRAAKPLEAMPRPVAYQASFANWDRPTIESGVAKNPDPGFAYLSGVLLISEMQRRDGHGAFVFFIPQWAHELNKPFLAMLDDEFGGYLRSHGVPFKSLAGMPMEAVRDTYDRAHQTYYGNKKIAAALFSSLEDEGLLDK
jgi:hypothetical protein